MRQACQKGAWKTTTTNCVYCRLNDNALKGTTGKLTKLTQICKDACCQLGLNYQMW